MKKIIILLFVSLIFSVNDTQACTSAIISGKVTKSGRPLLWKHRDTGEENNRIERIKAQNGKYEYVALFNANKKRVNDEAWMGMNTTGFAIMNTASYNLKNDNVKKMDNEGFLMAKALEVCKSVDDFEILLKRMKKPLRVEANFGVIDANGNGAYFEVNNTTYTKFDLADSPNGVLVRTNYSHSGRKDKGMGYIREQNAIDLLAPHILKKDIEATTFTEEISRSFYHSLIGYNAAEGTSTWVVDQDFIPRFTSTATGVIEGILPGEDASLTTFWIGLGYPPCSELRAVFLGENGIPEELTGGLDNGHSKLCDETIKRKQEIFSIKRGSGKKYLNIKKLYNDKGTGYCQTLAPLNIKYYEKINSILNEKRKKTAK